MTARTFRATLGSRRRQGWAALALAMLALALAMAAAIAVLRPPRHRVSVAGGSPGTTLNLIAATLVAELNARGIEARLAEASESTEMTAALEEKAEEQGRTVQALWAEAIEAGSEPAVTPPRQRDETE